MARAHDMFVAMLRAVAEAPPAGAIPAHVFHNMWVHAKENKDERLMELLISRLDSPSDLMDEFHTLKRPAKVRAAFLSRPDLDEQTVLDALNGETRAGVLTPVINATRSPNVMFAAVSTGVPQAAAKALERLSGWSPIPDPDKDRIRVAALLSLSKVGYHSGEFTRIANQVKDIALAGEVIDGTEHAPTILLVASATKRYSEEKLPFTADQLHKILDAAIKTLEASDLDQTAHQYTQLAGEVPAYELIRVVARVANDLHVDNDPALPKLLAKLSEYELLTSAPDFERVRNKTCGVNDVLLTQIQAAKSRHELRKLLRGNAKDLTVEEREALLRSEYLDFNLVRDAVTFDTADLFADLYGHSVEMVAAWLTSTVIAPELISRVLHKVQNPTAVVKYALSGTFSRNSGLHQLVERVAQSGLLVPEMISDHKVKRYKTDRTDWIVTLLLLKATDGDLLAVQAAVRALEAGWDGTIGELVKFTKELQQAAAGDSTITEAAIRIIEDGYAGDLNEIPALAGALAA